MVYNSNNIVNSVTSQEPAIGSMPMNIPIGSGCQATHFYIPARSPLAVLLSPAASLTQLERNFLAEEANKIVDIQPLTPFLGIATSCSS